MRLRSGTKNTACGLPMLTMEAGPSSAGPSPSRHSFTRRVSATACSERNGVPVEARRAHVDPVGPGSEPLAGDHAGLGLDRDGVEPKLAAEPVGDAARPVAAGARERAVVVVDHDAG